MTKSSQNYHQIIQTYKKYLNCQQIITEPSPNTTNYHKIITKLSRDRQSNVTKHNKSSPNHHGIVSKKINHHQIITKSSPNDHKS